MSFFSSPKPKVKCGVIGVGSLGQHHARIYSTLPNVEFMGIYESSDERAKEICAKYNCHRFASIAELGTACDAVSVVVPTDKHAEVAIPLRKAHHRHAGRSRARACRRQGQRLHRSSWPHRTL